MKELCRQSKRLYGEGIRQFLEGANQKLKLEIRQNRKENEIKQKKEKTIEGSRQSEHSMGKKYQVRGGKIKNCR